MAGFNKSSQVWEISGISRLFLQLGESEFTCALACFLMLEL
jgi:hypothetical protein